MNRTALLLAGAFSLLPAGVRAGRKQTPPPRPTAERELERGAADEADGLFARALAHYGACVDSAPGSPAARSARMRMMWIDQRAEGGFVPLATLVRVRRDPAPLGDPVALARLAAATESFPAGLVRSELRLRLGEAWLRLGGHRSEGLAELRAVVSDPSSGAADRRLAERELLDAQRADHRLDPPRRKTNGRPARLAAAAALALTGIIGLYARRRGRR